MAECRNTTQRSLCYFGCARHRQNHVDAKCDDGFGYAAHLEVSQEKATARATQDSRHAFSARCGALARGRQCRKKPDARRCHSPHVEAKKEGTGPAGWFEKQLTKGRCLVMLDGLDEVSNAALLSKVVEWVQQQINNHGNNRFIITSRPFGYRDNPLQSVSVLGARPFPANKCGVLCATGI